jgi:hypothetical protein
VKARHRLRVGKLNEYFDSLGGNYRTVRSRAEALDVPASVYSRAIHGIAQFEDPFLAAIVWFFTDQTAGADATEEQREQIRGRIYTDLTEIIVDGDREAAREPAAVAS